MTILVTFATHEGQTERIAARIADDLVERRFRVEVVEVGDAPAPGGYEAVVIGSPIRYERHGRAIARYLRRHHSELDAIPFALFQLSMTSTHSDDEHTTKAQQLVDTFLERTGVHPDLIGTFAGALRYSQYGWVTARVMRSIARREGNDTDTSHDHEYTDWEQVDRFATDVSGLVTKEATR
jgi:menaquinone-dependent protoporphyrinogen oxidase